MSKKPKNIEIKVRFYPGQDDDRRLIEWLDQFENAPYGAKQQAIKAALLCGIQGENLRTESSSPAAIDWSMLRQVVGGALESVLARMQIAPTAPTSAATDASTDVSDYVASMMSLWNDDDDE